jgi:catechol 2,3-dioxygenase-like lactoylglutathione lyase family enzyme
MRLNHLNLIVDDLAAARSFFTELFDFELVRSGGDQLAILTDGRGFTLVLMTGAMAYPDSFHIGFIVDSHEAVEAQYERALTYGIPVEQPPARRHGSYAFYFRALNGILFEVAA